MDLEATLQSFADANRMRGKGPLCVALVVTRHAMDLGLPLDPKDLLTEGGGQVRGLGRSAVQAILKDHGICRVLAEEGGRTSRGSIGRMEKLVELLNGLDKAGPVALDRVESWWVDQVKAFLVAKPFVLRFDASRSLRAVVRDLLEQAETRQAQTPGATHVGTMLQHLVGAKLNLLLDSPVEHFGASVADTSSGREGDFLVEDVAIHVTAAPSEALLRKCRKNLDSSLKPIVVTTSRGAVLADGLAEQAGIADRIDVFEAEQFIAGNLYELGKFGQSGRRTTADQLVQEYNVIEDDCETDPSLGIELAG